ncbi:DUF1566 domain-containing protein [Saccharobesus litoralis]|uniref:DUF1566 domain-containing protein n=2 Tax=Saccharobesus litoralis TaxID=2172099 RepID=A0A2S0VSK8_9ALTE|nr:DUF1566 domain-containing protein [Saccharobesus litoralis]
MLATLVFGQTVQAAQVCLSGATPSTPTEQFNVDTTTGIATDQKTGLSWFVCSAGLTWNATTGACEGTANTYSWQDALTYADTFEYANFTDWRLPNIKELMSIIERQCSTPAINITVFTDNLTERYWSSSPVIASDGNGGVVGDTVWAVSFEEGSNNTPLKTSNSLVRLVRKVQ